MLCKIYKSCTYCYFCYNLFGYFLLPVVRFLSLFMYLAWTTLLKNDWRQEIEIERERKREKQRERGGEREKQTASHWTVLYSIPQRCKQYHIVDVDTLAACQLWTAERIAAQLVLVVNVTVIFDVAVVCNQAKLHEGSVPLWIGAAVSTLNWQKDRWTDLIW